MCVCVCETHTFANELAEWLHDEGRDEATDVHHQGNSSNVFLRGERGEGERWREREVEREG